MCRFSSCFQYVHINRFLICLSRFCKCLLHRKSAANISSYQIHILCNHLLKRFLVNGSRNTDNFHFFILAATQIGFKKSAWNPKNTRYTPVVNLILNDFFFIFNMDFFISLLQISDKCPADFRIVCIHHSKFIGSWRKC